MPKNKPDQQWTPKDQMQFDPFGQDKVPAEQSPAKVFNELAPCPLKDVELGDGRILRIKTWKPTGSTDNVNGTVPVAILGEIHWKE